MPCACATKPHNGVIWKCGLAGSDGFVQRETTASDTIMVEGLFLFEGLFALRAVYRSWSRNCDFSTYKNDCFIGNSLMPRSWNQLATHKQMCHAWVKQTVFGEFGN